MSLLEEKGLERKPPIRETLDKINKRMEREKSERDIPECTRKIEQDR